MHGAAARPLRRAVVMSIVALIMTLLSLWPGLAWAQTPVGGSELGIGGGAATPAYWYLLTAALALLMPAGFVLVGVAGLEPERAWDAALGALAAIGLAGLGYWAVGFAFQFGGVGLVYPQDGLRELVWEWSPFAADWGAGWGVAGLSGWFLSGASVTPLTYALFLGHVPWAMTAALLPIVALRGRAPATATLFLALVMGGFVYPVAGNWVRGGGWLGALGNNLQLGHGFVDFGGAGTVHLVASGIALAALVVWIPRRRRVRQDVTLTPAQLPLLAVVGSLLIMAGGIGWLWTNPLQMSTLGELALMRGSVNMVLFAAGGTVVPLLYTWFVTGRSEPLFSARGLAAGVVAGLAAGPFVQPGWAFLIGFFAGSTVPFVTYVVDGLLRLDDATGAISVSGLPAVVGLFLVGLFADGAAGQGWQMTGVNSYLGVSGQGVTGLLAGEGYQMDFPGQIQAQMIGILSLALWGFVVGMLICAPLGLVLHSLLGGRAGTSEAAAPGGFDAEYPGTPGTLDSGAPYASPATRQPQPNPPQRELAGRTVRPPDDRPGF